MRRLLCFKGLGGRVGVCEAVEDVGGVRLGLMPGSVGRWTDVGI